MAKIEKVIHVPAILDPKEVLSVEQIEVVADIYDFKLGKLSKAQLIDDYANVKTYEAQFKKWVETVNKVLKAKCEIPFGEGSAVFEGKIWQITHSRRSRRFLSEEKLIAKYGAKALEDCYDETPYTEIRCAKLVTD